MKGKSGKWGTGISFQNIREKETIILHKGNSAGGCVSSPCGEKKGRTWPQKRKKARTSQSGKESSALIYITEGEKGERISQAFSGHNFRKGKGGGRES